MTDLDPRLHRLRDALVPPGPDAAEVRARAGRRRSRRHRRTLFAAIPVVAALVVGAAVLTTHDDGSQSVITGDDPTTTGTPASTSTTVTVTSTTRPGTSIGNVEGLSVQVAPTTDLRDGQLVTVEIEGLDRLATPVIILCAGDVTSSSAARDCDLTPLEPGGRSEGIDGPRASQEVAVRRVIRLPRMADEVDDQGGDFDCATEPVGCALVVGNSSLPATGVGVAVTFAGGTGPQREATATPAEGLADGQEVRVDATGLRPNSTFVLTQCSTTGERVCDEMTWPAAKTDGAGRLQATYRATTAIYGWKGRADCTDVPCAIQIRTEGGEPQTEAPIAFASGAVAPMPRLEVSPAGPYADQQVVTVTGTGFPVGLDISWELGQCPNGKDTAVEERCGYDTTVSNVIVDGDGRFTTQIRLHTSGACGDRVVGCHLGWVINHGPTLAKVPLTFR